MAGTLLKSYRVVLSEVTFCSFKSYLLRGGRKPDKETAKIQRAKKISSSDKYYDGIESSYMTMAEGYFSLEAIRDSPEEVMLRLRLNGNNV